MPCTCRIVSPLHCAKCLICGPAEKNPPNGTTLMAAERVGRLARGMEIDPLYVDGAIRRWQRFTGEFAVHADTGQRFNDAETAP